MKSVFRIYGQTLLGCWEAARNHGAAVKPRRCRVVTVADSRPDPGGEVPTGLEKPLQVRLFSLFDKFFSYRRENQTHCLFIYFLQCTEMLTCLP